MTHKPMAVLLCMLTSLLSFTPTWADSKCGSFTPVKTSEFEIKRNYESNVLQVASGGETGTGFLIDPEHGYVITAAHVVKASIDDPSVPIHLSHKNLGSQILNAHHLRNSHDVALLQLDPPDVLKELAFLDVSFALPDRLDQVVIIGYGSDNDPTQITDQGAAVLEQDAEAFNVTMNAWGGDSGAPAIDVYGHVIGVGVQYWKNTLVAQFIPIFVVQDLFTNIALTIRVKDLDTRIRAKTIGVERIGHQADSKLSTLIKLGVVYLVNLRAEPATI